MALKAQSMPKEFRSVRASRRATMVLSYVAMVLLSVLFMFPWFWTMGTSLKRAPELFIYPPPFVPEIPQWDNYIEVFRRVPFFGRFFINSTIVVVLSTGGGVLSALLVAYSFARFEWRGRDIIFGITLATMMLPDQVTQIPKYLLFKYLKWMDTIKPLWVPAWFGGGAFSIFLIRQFIMSIPRELDEAAKIDGANPLRVLVTILLPLMKPVIATISVMSFLWGWNDFMGPLIYLATPEKFTVALGMRYFDVTPAGQSWGMPTDHLLMAASVMSTLPIIILFFSAQRYFVQGIVMSGIKG